MAESFLLVAQQVLMLYLIMAVGFVLGKARLIDDRGSVAMSNLVMYAVSPSILVVAFQRELDMASLRNFGLVLLVALAVHILAAVSVLLVRDKDPQRQSCLRFAVVFANCGFMGYPLMSAMLGSEGVFYGSAYVVVFTVLSWTLGVYIMTRDRHCLAIKPIFCNPGTISVIVAMALYLLQIQLPEILLVPITHLSNLNTPLPMVVLGYQLSHANFRVALQGRGAWVSMILRLVVLPLAALGLCLLLNLPSGLTVVLVIAASTPPAALLGMFAARFGNDTALASSLVSVQTAFSAVTMPLIVGLKERSEGTSFSLLTFVSKLTGSLATAVSAALIPVIGLQQVNQDMVLPEGGELNTRFLLWAIVTIIPAVLNLLSLIPFIFYDLEGEKLDTIHRELAQRRENLTGAAADAE